MKAQACFVLATTLNILAAPALAQSADSCGDVLRLTGREETIFSSLDIGSEYTSWGRDEGRHRAVASGGAYGAIKGHFDYSDSRTKSEYSTTQREWRRELFRHADQVFEPAVTAWATCMAASAAGIAVTQRLLDHEKALMITFLRQPGSTGEILGFVVPDKVACTEESTGKSLGAASVIQLEFGKMWSARCARGTDGTEPRQIVVRLNQAHTPTLNFTLPELAGPPRQFEATTATQLLSSSAGKGCFSPLGGVISPKPYDRTLKIAAVSEEQLYNASSSATINVQLNGSPIDSVARSGLQGFTTVSTEQVHELPAFVAGLVEVYFNDSLANCSSARVVVAGP